jgi:hypothetical protein
MKNGRPTRCDIALLIVSVPQKKLRRIRMHWPDTRITVRGDGHYGRREAMDWCEQNRVHYIFGLSPNAVLAVQVFAKTDDVYVRRATANLDLVRDYTETSYGAKSWSHPRRVVARIEATRKGLDVRYVVTNITYVPPRGSMTASTAHAGRQRT